MELVGILEFIKENYKEYGKPILVPRYCEGCEATPVIAYIDIVLDIACAVFSSQNGIRLEALPFLNFFSIAFTFFASSCDI